MSRAVAVVVCGVVEVRGVEVEVSDFRVLELGYKLALLLAVNQAATVEAELPLVEKLAGAGFGEVVLQPAFERRPACAALVELEADVALVVGVRVEEERDGDLVEQFSAGHVNADAADIGNPEGDEVEVVV